MCLRGPGHQVFVLAILLAGCRGRPPYEGKSVEQLVGMVEGSNPTARAQGAYGLSLMGAKAKPAVPALVAALQDSQALTRQNAALALSHMGNDAAEAVPALISALDDSAWTVRRQAALALGDIGPAARQAIPSLKRMARDRNTLLQKTAKDVLRKLEAG